MVMVIARGRRRGRGRGRGSGRGRHGCSLGSKSRTQTHSIAVVHEDEAYNLEENAFDSGNNSDSDIASVDFHGSVSSLEER